MSVQVFIVSYLGNDSDLIQKRLEFHNKQLDWILSQDSNIQINVFDQNYKPEWRRAESNINYYRYSGPTLKQWQVRNQFYDDFYNSDLDLSIFMDNDTALYDHFDGPKFFKFINEKQQDLVDNKVCCFIPIDPGRSPFNNYVGSKKKLYDSNYIFNPVRLVRTAFYGLLNLKKHFNKTVYFRDFSENLELGVSDDTFFSFDLMKNGLTAYKTYNFILKDFVGDKYSLLFDPNHSRIGMMNDVFVKICDEGGVRLHDDMKKTRKLLNDHMIEKYNLRWNKIFIEKVSNQFF